MRTNVAHHPPFLLRGGGGWTTRGAAQNFLYGRFHSTTASPRFPFMSTYPGGNHRLPMRIHTLTSTSSLGIRSASFSFLPLSPASSSRLSSLQMTQRSFFLVSKNKVRTQLSVLKHEADTARKNAKDDVEKAKRYGIRAFGMDMLDVVDTLEKGIEAFDLHRQRFGNSLFSQEDATTTARNSTSSSPTSPTSETNTENPPSATVSTVDTEPCHTTDPISPPSTNREAELKSLESIFTGIQLSMRVLQKHLRTHGIEKIPVQCGDPFDPSVHEAMSSVPSSATLPAETIANVLKGGYKIKDRVLRPAQVVVVVAAAVGDEKDGA